MSGLKAESSLQLVAQVRFYVEEGFIAGFEAMGIAHFEVWGGYMEGPKSNF